MPAYRSLTRLILVFAFTVAAGAAVAKGGVDVPTPVPEGHFLQAMAWSPNGETIAYSVGGEICESDSALYLVNPVDQTLLKTLPVAECTTNNLDWSPDSTRLAGTSGDSFGVRVWDITTGQLTTTTKRGGQGQISVRWNPITNRLISTNVSNDIYVLNPLTGEEVQNYGNGLNNGGIYVDWSPDGTRIVSSNGSDNSIFITNLVTNENQSLEGHATPSSNVDWSPDGSKIASASWDGTTRIWDANTGQPLAVFNVSSPSDVRWNPNSRHVAVASFDGFVQVWDTETGQITDTYTNPGRVYAIAWSPDGTQLAYGGVGLTGELTIVEPNLVTQSEDYIYLRTLAWSPNSETIAYSVGGEICDSSTNLYLMDSSNHTVSGTLPTGECAISSLDWSPTGEYLAAASGDSFGVRVWDVATGQLTTTTKRGGQGESLVRWKPMGDQLLSANIAGYVYVLNPITGEEINRINVGASSIDWSPDGTNIVSSNSFNNLIFITNLVTDENQSLEGHSTPSSRVDWSPDGSKIASASWDGTTRIWDAHSGQSLAVFNVSSPTDVRWNPNSRHVAVASFDGFVQVWDVETGQITDTYTNPGRVYAIAWSPDGTQLAYGGVGLTGELTIVQPEIVTGSATIIETAIPTPVPAQAYLQSVAWSPDGTMIAYSIAEDVCSPPRDGSLFIVNATTGNLIKTLPISKCSTLDIAWSPDSTHLAGVSGDELGFRVWDVATGLMTAIAPSGGQGDISVDWRPNSAEIFVTHMGGGGDIYNAETGQLLKGLDIPATHADWSPDGTSLASVSYYTNNVYIADAENDLLQMTLEGHSEPAANIDWSPDGSKLASASFDGTVRIWDAVTGQSLITLNVSSPSDVRWNPNSRHVAVASFDGFVQVWDVETGQITDTYTNPGEVIAIAWSPDGTQLAYGGEGFTGKLSIVQPEIVTTPPVP